MVDGIRFDSKREARRWVELRALQRAGRIGGLRRQVRIPLVVQGARICAYVADFTYVEKGARVVEDAKGVKTPTYKLKKRLIKALYGIEIREV